ncbi:MAG: proline dehydrogenase family protein [Candidatus Micrarchaeota archaeon]
MIASIVRGIGNFFFLRVMGRWVAGAKAEDAVRYCTGLNSKGSACVINFLGEHYLERTLAEAAVREYAMLTDRIAEKKARASITIKPSQFGFDAKDVPYNGAFCEKKMLEAVRYAASKGVAVWLDMEDSRHTDFTLAFYKKHSGRYRMGVCIQANLKRSGRDLLSLIVLSQEAPVMVRLVKGIYAEGEEIAHTGPQKIHGAFLALIREAFEKSPPDFGIAVGTHHSEAISLALAMQKKFPKKFFEIEVLKGVLPAYYEELRGNGVPVTEYVPYGPDAFAYSVRRAWKNPRFARSVLLSLFFDAYKKLYGGLSSDAR